MIHSNVSCMHVEQHAVKIDNITVKYGEVPAIAGVSFHIKEGDFLGIIGPNGGGKTTLIKAMIGLKGIASGKISIYGHEMKRVPKLISYVPQVMALDRKFPITVREVVLTGVLNPALTLFYKYKRRDIKKIDALLERVGIYKLRNRMISELSGGEFQKMLIARALAVEPKILLLDEPTASVDASAREQIFNLLSDINKRMTIILVTHDLTGALAHVKTLACLNRELLYHGAPQLNEEVIKALYGYPIGAIGNGTGILHAINEKMEDE